MKQLLCFAAAVTLIAGCVQQESGPAGENTLERIQRQGVVKVGYANEAPYAYMDSEQQRLTGEAPEILRVIMKELGVDEVEGVLTEFGSLIPGLKAGRFDVIAAGMYITPERCEQAAFSNPTYGIGEGFIVAAGNPKQLHGYEDVVNDSSVTLGVVAGTVERGYARDMGVPDERVTVFPDPPSAIAGVASGRVDAYAGTSLTVGDLLAKSTGDKLERAEPFTDPVINGESVRGYGAFVVRNEDTELLNAINAELARFIGTDAHLELVEPFGFGETELPGDVTAAVLCGGAP